jgi:hypothetical protein|tara:strand:- start:1027 stop:1341 length:315 start_codon:yes stop_codon:yes gene_type:complete
MSILTTISGVPLFSTIFEARSWAIENGCRGHHVHRFKGQNGYMGCTGHNQASDTLLNISTTPRVVSRNINTTTNTNMNRNMPINRTVSGGSSTSTGGSGGGGGY